MRKEPRRAILVGRFQPFHLGHLQAVQYILKKVDELVIAIGSAQFSHTLENPFTAGERVTMIRLALQEASVDASKYYLIPVSDVNIHKIWVSHLVSFTPSFHTAFSNEPLTMRLFKEAGYKVERIPMFNRDVYSATEIRSRMLKSQSWQQLVPDAVKNYIKQLNGDERLVELSISDKPVNQQRM